MPNKMGQGLYVTKKQMQHKNRKQISPNCNPN